MRLLYLVARGGIEYKIASQFALNQYPWTEYEIVIVLLGDAGLTTNTGLDLDWVHFDYDYKNAWIKRVKEGLV